MHAAISTRGSLVISRFYHHPATGAHLCPGASIIGAAVVVCVAVCLLLAVGCRSTPPEPELRVEVFNPHSETWRDAPITLRLANYPVALEPFARVYRVRGDSLTEFPSQLDDVDLDGRADELFFLIDLNEHETARYVIRPDSVRPKYSSRIDSTSLIDYRAVFRDAEGLTPDRAALWMEDGFASILDLDSARMSLIANGPLRVLVRTDGQLEVESASFVLNEVVEMHAGSRWVEHRVSATNNPDQRPFVAGLPRQSAANRLHSGSIHGQFYLYTLGPQSSDVSTLGLALLVPERLRPRLLPINPTDHRIQIASEDGAAAYRYMAARAEDAAGDAAADDPLTHEKLLEMIGRAADRWTNPVQVTVTYDRPRQ